MPSGIDPDYSSGFEEWKQGDSLVLSAQLKYYKGVHAIKRIVRKVIPESFNRVAMFKAGSIDFAVDLTPKEIDSLQGVKGIKVSKGDSRRSSNPRGKTW